MMMENIEGQVEDDIILILIFGVRRSSMLRLKVRIVKNSTSNWGCYSWRNLYDFWWVCWKGSASPKNGTRKFL